MGWVILGHVAAPTSDMITFSSLSLTGYQRVALVFDGITVGTDGAFLHLQLSTSGTFYTAGYRYRIMARSSSGSDNNDASESASFVRLIGGTISSWGIGNAAGKTGSGHVELSHLTGSGPYPHVVYDGHAVAPSGAAVRFLTGGHLEQTTAIDGVRLLMSTGTMTAGWATLYGLKIT